LFVHVCWRLVVERAGSAIGSHAGRGAARSTRCAEVRSRSATASGGRNARASTAAHPRSWAPSATSVVLTLRISRACERERNCCREC
jgi:hypothetical protein